MSFPARKVEEYQHTRDAVERLRLWYTIDEMASLMGLNRHTLAMRMRKLKLGALLRKSCRGATARVWDRRERTVLIGLCEQVTQSEAGQLLHRSKGSVARAVPGQWWRGTVSASAVARLANCSTEWVSTVAMRLMPGCRIGTGRSARWRLDLEDCERLMQHIRPGRVDRVPELFE